jgi:hypothetical protein
MEERQEWLQHRVTRVLLRRIEEDLAIKKRNLISNARVQPLDNIRSAAGEISGLEWVVDLFKGDKWVR